MQVCFGGAKQETTTRTPPSERQLIVPPWRGTGLEASPALSLATRALTAEGRGVSLGSCGRTLQRERFALSNVLLCQTEVSLFSANTWGLKGINTILFSNLVPLRFSKVMYKGILPNSFSPLSASIYLV